MTTSKSRSSGLRQWMPLSGDSAKGEMWASRARALCVLQRPILFMTGVVSFIYFTLYVRTCSHWQCDALVAAFVILFLPHVCVCVCVRARACK